tara:strand:+ start:38 stop:655 length:618 start_codon:yes stop_codon:yes gene_type:complete
MKIGIVDYEAGNMLSVFNSIYNLGYDPVIIKESKNIKNMDKLVIPGVGSAYHALLNLNKNGFIEELKKFYDQGKPILGICLGLQIFGKKLLEDGNSDGIGLFDGIVKPLKKPQVFNIGWCKVDINLNLAEKIGLNKISDFYFCHSFFLDLAKESKKKLIYGNTVFHENIPAIVIKNNFIGSQFHPEKSQSNGRKFIKYFLDWKFK